MGKRFNTMSLVLLTILIGVTFISCKNPTASGGGYVYERNFGAASEYTATLATGSKSSETAAVDYSSSYMGGGDAGSIVYFDFSTGTKTTKDHDIWDIAIATTGGTMISNSGDYGYGVRVLRTDESDISTDLTAREAEVTQQSFRPLMDLSYDVFNTQTELNPLQDAIGAGMGDGKVYIIKDEAGVFYKLKVTKFGPMGQYSLQVVTGLAGATVRTISGGLAGASDYDYLYFDLGAGAAISVAPAKADWDIRFARTEEWQSDEMCTGRSDILLNTAAEVKAAEVSGNDIDTVTSTSGLSFYGAIDTIGYAWYGMEGMPPTFFTEDKVFVIRTGEGGFAKFRALTFAGPGGEKFHVNFNFQYQN